MSDVVEFDSSRRKKPKPLPKPIVSEAWEEGLLKKRASPELLKNVANVTLVMMNAPEWKDAISWDEFAERIVITRACPAGSPGPWTDLSDVQSAVWLQRSRWRLDASHELVANAVRAVAAANSVHPLRARLEGLKWDGVDRIETWTTKYLGAEDTPVHREIGKRWLLGAISRAFVPGSQVDTALILEGEQGRGKSTAVRTLSLGFFTDELADIGSKDAAMQLHGAWIIELPELDAMGRAQTSAIKAFLTRRSDRYRAPYGRHVAEHGRQCTFAGTVNHNDYLRDETGGRRFLPVAVGVIDNDGLKSDVDQLWAESVQRYKNGECTYTTNAELNALIADHTSERYQGDVWHDIVSTYAELHLNITIDDVLSHVGVERAKRGQADANRVAKVLKSIGFTRTRVTVEGKRQWRYMRQYMGRRDATGALVTLSNQTTSPSVPVVPVYMSNSNEEGAQSFQVDLQQGVDTGSTGTSGTGCFDDLLFTSEDEV